MTSTTRSVLLTAIRRQLDATEVAEFAHALGVNVRPLIHNKAEISDALRYASAEPVVYTGTGNLNFDAKAAAAMGVAMVIQTPIKDVSTELALAEIDQLGATVAAMVIGDKPLTDAIRAAQETIAEQVMTAEVFEHWLLARAKENRARIVLPEGDDDRILTAAHQLLEQDICELTILGDPAVVL